MVAGTAAAAGAAATSGLAAALSESAGAEARDAVGAAGESPRGAFASSFPVAAFADDLAGLAAACSVPDAAPEEAGLSLAGAFASWPDALLRRRRRPPRRPRRRRWLLLFSPSCADGAGVVRSLSRFSSPLEASLPADGAGAGTGACFSPFAPPALRLLRVSFSCPPAAARLSLSLPERADALDLPPDRPPDLPLEARSEASPERLRREPPLARLSLRRRLSPVPRLSSSVRLRRALGGLRRGFSSGVGAVSSSPPNKPPNRRLNSPGRGVTAAASGASGSEGVGAGVACAMRLTAGSSVLPSVWPILRRGSASISVRRA